MHVCTKKDAMWLTALMLDADVFGGCSEDGVERHKMGTYIKAMLSRPDMLVVAPVPGKMVHTFYRRTGVMWEIHTAIKKNSGLSGKEKVQLTKAACIWMVQSKGVRKFITHVPVDNRAAGIYAKMCGLERVGILTQSIKKDGQLIDMSLYQSNDKEVNNVLLGGK